MRTIIETDPSRPAGNPSIDTPLKKWIALAVAFTGKVTDLGILEGSLPNGPYSITAFGTRSPCGSTSANGTPSTTFGPQSSKINRAVSVSESDSMLLVVVAVATL